MVDRYGEIIRWVNSRDYRDYAKDIFNRGADPWLIAFASVHQLTVVTLEKSEPQSRKDVKIPDVCIGFGVTCIDTFEMLRSLGVHFHATFEMNRVYKQTS